MAPAEKLGALQETLAEALGTVDDEDVLAHAVLLQGFYQVDEMFAGTIERFRQINMTDMHVRSGRR